MHELKNRLRIKIRANKPHFTRYSVIFRILTMTNSTSQDTLAVYHDEQNQDKRPIAKITKLQKTEFKEVCGHLGQF